MTLEPQSIPELVRRRAAAAPDKPFLFSEADKRQFTYREFAAVVRRLAGMLWANGVRKGDVVSLLLPNSVEYVFAYFACWHIGALAGPINSLLKAQEIAYVISNSEAKLLLVNTEFLPAVETNDITIIPFDNVEQFTGQPVEETQISTDDEAIIIYTSGTTGKPKGCLLTHGNVIANARQISSWLHFTESDRLLTMMPLFHMNAVSVTTMSALYAGGSTVVSPKFSASRFWQIISDYEITSFGSVATMLSMLLSTYPDGVPRGLKTDQLRFAMCGSAPVPAEVLRRFEETFNCLVIEGYGLSESTCRSTFNPPDKRRRPGSCGL
ncbi:MAG TPA: class I adenylate-forming enzyme family protein, partial [Pyrinomonadaceae bacterium]|nr:class I adenylate-forming enzyme family protein [Pyrinomonadaceae bacterium]